MGVAEGLGVPLEITAGAVCVGAFFGDKVSPLSDSPVITASVTDVDMITGIKHSLITTLPAWAISLIFFFFYGMRFDNGNVGGDTYNEIIGTVSEIFNFNILMLLPVVVVIVLIVMKKPTIPTFVAGAAVAILVAMITQGASLTECITIMYSGYAGESGSEIVDSMLNRGGMSSMLSTILILMAAGIFGGPLRTAGVIDVLLDFTKKFAKTSRTMAFTTMLFHAVFFTITGAYYVSYPVVGGMVKDLYPAYGLDKKNLMREMLDTGTGFAPLVPWSTTGSYTATTLGVSNMSFALYAPMLWLSIIFSAIIALTGIGLAKLKDGSKGKEPAQV